MADQRLDVIISATDQASAVIAKVKNDLQGLQTQASAGANAQGFVQLGQALGGVGSALAVIGAAGAIDVFQRLAAGAEDAAEKQVKFQAVLDSGNAGKIVGEMNKISLEFAKFDELNQRFEDAWAGTGSIWEGFTAGLALTAAAFRDWGADRGYLDKLQENFEKAAKAASNAFIQATQEMSAKVQASLLEVQQKALEIDLGAAIRQGDWVDVERIRQQIAAVIDLREEAAIEAIKAEANQKLATDEILKADADARVAHWDLVAEKQDLVYTQFALLRQKDADDEEKATTKTEAAHAASMARRLEIERDVSLNAIENNVKILNSMKDQIPIGELYAQQQTLAGAAMQVRLTLLEKILAEELKAVTGPGAADKRAELELKAAADRLTIQDDFYTASTARAVAFAGQNAAREDAQFALRRTLGQASIADEVAHWAARVSAAVAGTAEQDQAIQRSLQAQRAMQQESLSQVGEFFSAQTTLEQALANGRIATMQQVEAERKKLMEAAFKAYEDFLSGRPANLDLVTIAVKMIAQGNAGVDLNQGLSQLLQQATAKLTADAAASPPQIPAKVVPTITLNGQVMPLSALEGPSITLNGQPIDIKAKVKPSITLNGQEIDLAALASGSGIVLNSGSPAILDAGLHMDEASTKLFADLTEFFDSTIDPAQFTLTADPAIQRLFEEPPVLGIDPAQFGLFTRVLETWQKPFVSFDDAALNRLYDFFAGPKLIGIDSSQLTLFTLQLESLELPAIVFSDDVQAFLNQPFPEIRLSPGVLEQLGGLTLPDIALDPAVFDLFGQTPPRIGIDPAAFTLLDRVDALTLPSIELGPNTVDQIAALDLPQFTVDPAAISLFGQDPPEIGINPAAFTLLDGLQPIGIDPAAAALLSGGVPSIGIDPAAAAILDGVPPIGLDPAVTAFFGQPFPDIGLAPNIFDTVPTIGLDPASFTLLDQIGQTDIGIDPEAFALLDQLRSITLPSIGLDPSVPVQIASLQVPQVGVDPSTFTLLDQLSGIDLPRFELDPAVTNLQLPSIGLSPNVFDDINGLTLPDITADPAVLALFSTNAPQIGLDPAAFALFEGGLPQITLDSEATGLLTGGSIEFDVTIPPALQDFLGSDFTVDVNIDPTAFSLFSQPINVTTNIDPALFTLTELAAEPISIGFDPAATDAITSLGQLTEPGGFEIDLQLGAGFDTANQLIDEFTAHVVDQGAVIRDAIADGARNGLADGVVDAIVDNLTEGIQQQLSNF